MKWDGQNMFILENMWKCFVTWIWNRYAGYEMGRNAVPRKSCGGPAPVVWAAVAQQPFVCGSVPERRTLAKSLPNLRTGNHWNIWMNPKGVILRKQTSTMHFKKAIRNSPRLRTAFLYAYDIIWYPMIADGYSQLLAFLKGTAKGESTFETPSHRPHSQNFAGNGSSQHTSQLNMLSKDSFQHHGSISWFSSPLKCVQSANIPFPVWGLQEWAATQGVHGKKRCKEMETMRGSSTLEILNDLETIKITSEPLTGVAEGTMGSGSVHSTASTGIALGASQGKVWDWIDTTYPVHGPTRSLLRLLRDWLIFMNESRSVLPLQRWRIKIY